MADQRPRYTIVETEAAIMDGQFGIAHGEPRLLRDVGDLLFHYTTLQRGLENILPEMQLRLSPFSQMRDPRESKFWGLSSAGYGEQWQLGHQREVEISSKINLLKDTCKLLSFTQDDPSGETSYRRGYARPRLWEQYSGRSTGLCLAFDRERLTASLRGEFEESLRFDHGPVEYNDAPLSRDLFLDVSDSVLEQSAEAHFESFLEKRWRALFFVKLTDWATEHEYRYVVRTEHTKPVMVGIRDSLTDIIIGSELPVQYFPSIRQIVKDTDVRIWRLVWLNSEPMLYSPQV